MYSRAFCSERSPSLSSDSIAMRTHDIGSFCDYSFLQSQERIDVVSISFVIPTGITVIPVTTVRNIYSIQSIGTEEDQKDLPKSGYQTITLRSTLFEKLVETYERKKRDLIMEDVKSYTAYAQKLLDRAIEQDTLEGRFEIIDRVDNRVVVKDYYKVKRVEVEIKNGRVYCLLDESSDCDHVGYVLSDPSVIKRARELGVKLRKATA